MHTDVAIQCAKLQHVVNYRVIPDCARIELNIEVDGLKCVSARRFNGLAWGVFDGGGRRFIVFRGYRFGTLLPLPIPVSRTLCDEKHRVNMQPYNEWRHAWNHIRKDCIVNDDISLIVTGYSVGAAAAVFTTLFFAPVDQTYIFSPLAFCDAALYDRISFAAIWVYGDCIPSLYARIFAKPPTPRVVAPNVIHPSLFGVHDTRTIQSAVKGSLDEALCDTRPM
jgi:hypothetical protein